MALLAQYPINGAALGPYIGRPVAAVLPDGEVVPGVLHRVDGQHVVLSPLQATGAQIASIKQRVLNDPSVEASIKNVKANPKPVQTKALGFGYPLGWGFGNWGWGAGLWWIWPLLFLAALFAFPFWW